MIKIKINNNLILPLLYFYIFKKYHMYIRNNYIVYMINNIYWLFNIYLLSLFTNSLTLFFIKKKKKWRRFHKINGMLIVKFKKKNFFTLKKYVNLVRSNYIATNYIPHGGFKKIKKNIRKKRLWRVKKLRFIFRKFLRLKLYKKKFNFLKFLNFSKIVNIRNQYTAAFSLKRRIFLNNSLVSKSILDCYYKQPKAIILKKHYIKNYSKVFNKNLLSSAELGNSIKEIFTNRSNNKIILLNYYKRLLWKIRQSRRTHWSLFKTGKINKWRYVLLFNKENLKEHKFNQFYKLCIIFLIHNNKISISWRHILLLEKYQLFVINGQHKFTNSKLSRGDIIEICFGIGLNKWELYTKKMSKRIFYRLKRWGYKAYKRNIEGAPKIFKKYPKSIKSLTLGYKTFGKSVVISRGIGLAVILYSTESIITTNPLLSIHKTSIFKLNNWRYRFN